jgi:TonB family protein
MKLRISYLLLAALLLGGCASTSVIVRDETEGGVALPGGGKRRLVKTVAPYYPAHLRKEMITGIVIVRIWVASDGTVTKAVAQSSPNPELARSAENALLQWRFEPAADNSHRGMILELPITFGVEDDAKAK